MEVLYCSGSSLGGTVLVGGKRPEGLAGLYFEPTIIDCPRNDLTIVDTELFGPVLAVQRFRTEEEALSLAIPLYPRAEDATLGEAVFTEPGKQAMTDEDAKPFAGLASLRESLNLRSK